jgi:hypothetical protein
MKKIAVAFLLLFATFAWAAAEPPRRSQERGQTEPRDRRQFATIGVMMSGEWKSKFVKILEGSTLGQSCGIGADGVALGGAEAHRTVCETAKQEEN